MTLTSLSTLAQISAVAPWLVSKLTSAPGWMPASVLLDVVPPRVLAVMAPLQDPGVTPNGNGLPGLPALRQVVGALLTFGLVACVAGFVISAATWALSSQGGNALYAGKGKQGCIISGVAAVLIGSANAIIRFASGIQIN